jgi:hypothetical protein
MDSESGGSPVIATYREIADHFKLQGPNAARTKAKRAKWEEEPTNHPADTKRIKVPRDVWDGASETPRSRRVRGPSPERVSPLSQESPTPPSQGDESPTLKVLEGALTTLKEQLERERSRADRVERAGDLDRAAAAEERARLLTFVERADVRADREAARADQADARADRAEAELARLQAPPAAIPAPEAEADLVREDELNARPTDQLVATMATEMARARALVPAPTPRRGFLARLLNRKPAAPTV